jgi:hypothetical protein
LNLVRTMTRRNSPNDIHDLSQLTQLGEFVIDKRIGQRSIAKKNRRNRHYEKQFIRNLLDHPPVAEPAESVESAEPTPPPRATSDLP